MGRVQTIRKRKTKPLGLSSYLAVEGLPVQRPDEVAVHLIGSQDDGGHCVLVLRRRGGQQRQCGQGDVVLAAGKAALIVAVGAEAKKGAQGEMDASIRVSGRQDNVGVSCRFSCCLLLTLKPARMRLRTPRDREPCAPQYAPALMGSAPSSLSRRHHSGCFRHPACCSVRL